jgi:hypothetical protein
VKRRSFLFLVLLVLCAFMFPRADNAGDPYIQLNKEPGGDIDKGARAQWDGVYENQNGAMVWNGSDWVINNTWAHTYYTDIRTGLRLVEHSVLATFDGTGTGGVVGAGYTVTQETYDYCVPAASDGPAYCYAMGPWNTR